MLLKNRLKTLILENYALFSYLAVGLFSVVIYFSSFALLWQMMKINYKVSVTITYILTVLFHFSANRRFTFNAHGVDLGRHITKYACMIVGNYFITLSTMHIVVETLHLTPYIGIALAMIANTSINFIMARYWVFRVAS